MKAITITHNSNAVTTVYTSLLSTAAAVKIAYDTLQANYAIYDNAQDFINAQKLKLTINDNFADAASEIYEQVGNACDFTNHLIIENQQNNKVSLIDPNLFFVGNYLVKITQI